MSTYPMSVSTFTILGIVILGLGMWLQRVLTARHSKPKDDQLIADMSHMTNLHKLFSEDPLLPEEFLTKHLRSLENKHPSLLVRQLATKIRMSRAEAQMMSQQLKGVDDVSGRLVSAVVTYLDESNDPESKALGLRIRTRIQEMRYQRLKSELVLDPLGAVTKLRTQDPKTTKEDTTP